MSSSCAFCSGTFSPDELLSLDGASSPVCPACYELAEPSTDAASLTVGPIQRADLELVLAWRNNPVIYEHFAEQDGPIQWADHVDWFESRPPTRRDYVASYDGRRIGVVAVDASDFVSIYIAELTLWGEGLATRLLDWLTTRFHSMRDLQAEIHANNERSQRLFERCGFERTNREDDWYVYAYVGDSQ
ncbi:GNAT family N-acetyltransferase [Haloplanus aerogenes]|nr:GNAT family N-acetyltransferase [Haloplanus aerogenes]RMB18215.1 L-amino acid N-acyltransferase YncA [Haloplanus aerogenes]